MIAVLICLVSVAAFAQFGLYYWRATISGVAAQEVTDRIRMAAGIAHAGIGPQDFHNIIILKDLTPDLRGAGGSFRAVRAYYSIVQTLGKVVPMLAGWANSEMTTCARYVAVLMDQHLERNMACAAQVRGV